MALARSLTHELNALRTNPLLLPVVLLRKSQLGIIDFHGPELML